MQFERASFGLFEFAEVLGLGEVKVVSESAKDSKRLCLDTKAGFFPLFAN